MTLVYTISDAVGRLYVGSAVSHPRRWSEHRRMLRNGIHPNPKLQNAYSKHGESYFTFRVIEECHRGDLVCREQYHIDSLSPHYNIAKNARSSMLGLKHSDETKAKIGAANKIRNSGKKRGPHTDETKRKISIANSGNKSSLGSKRTKEQLVRMMGNKYSLGHRHSDEAREKMSISQKLRRAAEARDN